MAPTNIIVPGAPFIGKRKRCVLGTVPQYITVNGVLLTLLYGKDGQALHGADGQYLYGVV